MASNRATPATVNPPKKPTLYRSRDNLKNFYIRVELKKVRTSGPASTISIDQDQGAGSGSAIFQPSAAVQEYEELIFRWQEKVFSQDEEELYADANNCLNAWEESYHREIVEIRNKGGRTNSRLFSYVERDNFKSPVTVVSPVLLEPDYPSPLTYAARHDHQVRRRHRARASRDLASDAVRHPVSLSPSNDERISHRIATPTTKIMHIMADLRNMDGIDTADEHVLCCISVDENGVISVEPDFNPAPEAPAYRLENKHRDLFEYRMEHASKPMSSEALVKEKKLVSELCQKRVAALNNLVGSTFVEEIPDRDSLKVTVLGEIVSAWGFEYNQLYVCAHLELPEGWELEDGEHLLSPRSQLPCVTTQLCSTTSTHQHNVARFNCPLEFTLLHRHHDRRCDSDSPTIALPKWPRILVEVASQDSWDRHRIEGYGYLDLPRRPGLYKPTVETWRPVGKPFIDQMKRFFIGGPPEINDITYIATPKDFQGSHLSRYGFETESSGTVQFRFNITHQSWALVKEGMQSTARFKGFKGPLAAVLQSYQRAKDRALAASTLPPFAASRS